MAVAERTQWNSAGADDSRLNGGTSTCGVDYILNKEEVPWLPSNLGILSV